MLSESQVKMGPWLCSVIDSDTWWMAETKAEKNEILLSYL